MNRSVLSLKFLTLHRYSGTPSPIISTSELTSPQIPSSIKTALAALATATMTIIAVSSATADLVHRIAGASNAQIFACARQAIRYAENNS